MNELLNLVYVSDNIVETFVRLFILILSFDFLLSFSNGIKSIKDSIS